MSETLAKPIRLPWRVALLRPALNKLLARAFWSEDRDKGPQGLARVKRLLDWGADPNAPLDGGWTPLGALSLFQSEAGLALAEAFLAAGANPNQRCANGQTPLTACVEFKNRELCEVLIRAGANPERLNGLGRSALEVARAPRRQGTGPIRPPSAEEIARAAEADASLLALLNRAVIEAHAPKPESSGSPRPRL